MKLIAIDLNSKNQSPCWGCAYEKLKVSCPASNNHTLECLDADVEAGFADSVSRSRIAPKSHIWVEDLGHVY